MDQYWYCGILVKGMENVYSYISDSGEIPSGSYVMLQKLIQPPVCRRKSES